MFAAGLYYRLNTQVALEIRGSWTNPIRWCERLTNVDICLTEHALNLRCACNLLWHGDHVFAVCPLCPGDKCAPKMDVCSKHGRVGKNQYT